MEKVSAIAVLLFFISYAASAQDSEQWFFVHEDIAKISATDQYEKELKELFALYERTGNRHAPLTAQMNGNRYFMFYPLSAPGAEGLLAFNRESDAWMENVSEADLASVQQLAAPYEETHRSYLLRSSGELSYVPATPEANLDDQPYRHVSYNYLFRGKEGDARALLTRFRSLYAEKKIPYGYTVFLPGLGMDGTLVIMMWSARDAEHLEQKYKEVNALLGDAAAELQKEAQRTVRSLEELRGVIRPDLSFSPASGN